MPPSSSSSHFSLNTVMSLSERLKHRARKFSNTILGPRNPDRLNLEELFFDPNISLPSTGPSTTNSSLCSSCECAARAPTLGLHSSSKSASIDRSHCYMQAIEGGLLGVKPRKVPTDLWDALQSDTPNCSTEFDGKTTLGGAHAHASDTRPINFTLKSSQ